MGAALVALKVECSRVHITGSGRGQKAKGAYSEVAGGLLRAGDEVAAQEDGVALLHHRRELAVADGEGVPSNGRSRLGAQHNLHRHHAIDTILLDTTLYGHAV